MFKDMTMTLWKNFRDGVDGVTPQRVTDHVKRAKFARMGRVGTRKNSSLTGKRTVKAH